MRCNVLFCVMAESPHSRDTALASWLPVVEEWQNSGIHGSCCLLASVTILQFQQLLSCMPKVLNDAVLGLVKQSKVKL